MISLAVKEVVIFASFLTGLGGVWLVRLEKPVVVVVLEAGVKIEIKITIGGIIGWSVGWGNRSRPNFRADDGVGGFRAAAEELLGPVFHSKLKLFETLSIRNKLYLENMKT